LAAVVVLLALVIIVPCVVTLTTPPPSSARVADDAATRYPIVLAHGIMGFAYVGQQSYWHGMPETLRAHGAQVFVTQVSAFHSSELRGEQLLAQVRRIRQETGAEKVNLVGHSHGSQSVRYVAALHPEWVASVTAIAGPTTGSEVADWLADLDRQHPVVAGWILSMGNGVGQLINSVTKVDLPIDGRQAMSSLTSEGAAAFNRRFPAAVPEQPCGEGAHEVNGVRYYSWSSVGHFYHPLNLADYLMSLTGGLFQRERDNDGLVGKCASHLGQVIRDDYPMNHFQIVNQFSGLVGPGADPVGLMLAHAQRLKAAGL
jgi:triacylglycerol lipase